MITTDDCKSCLHDRICSFKNEYIGTCELARVTFSKYVGSVDASIGSVNASIRISIKCPHMLVEYANTRAQFGK